MSNDLEAQRERLYQAAKTLLGNTYSPDEDERGEYYRVLVDDWLELAAAVTSVRAVKGDDGGDDDE